MSEDVQIKFGVGDEKATIADLKAKLAAYEAEEKRRREDEALAEKIELEPRFRTARNTLALRRIKPEKLVSVREVFDFLEVVDKKKAAGGDVKRIYVSNAEFRTYRALKEQGKVVGEISLEMIKAAIKGVAGKVDDDDANGQDDDAATLDEATM